MTNEKISNFLFEIAEMLEISGDNRFRVVAYEQAAKAVEDTAEDLVDIYEEQGLEGLQGIKGIGKSIAEKITELIKTGQSKYYKALLKKVPKAELILIKIPGIGPKNAQKIYKKFKVESVSDLEKIARGGKIRNLSGFDEISEKNILENIKRLKKREKRLLISFVWPIAEECLIALNKCEAVKSCQAVGSLRRMKETIGDIDLVVASKKPNQVINYFINQKFVKKIKTKGKTKVSIIHKKGVAVDLEILPQELYGSLLQHLTGSKEHNIHLRKLANSKGLSLSEYGITNLKTKKIKHFKNEKSFYQALNLEYILPELREDRGEIEAAASHELPRLIKLSDMQGDLHLHTNWSEGDSTIEEMVKNSIKKGYKYIAITDHTKGLGITHGMDEKRILKQIGVIQKLNIKYQSMKIFSGVEVNIKADTTLDISDEILAQLDIVIASIHSSFYQNEERINERLIKTIRNPYVKIIAHPSGRLIRRRESYDADWKEIFKEASRNNVALEINSFPERLDLKDVLVQEAKEYGVKFAINTDAHDPEHLDLINYGIAVARRGWLEKKDVINAWDAKKIINWLKK